MYCKQVGEHLCVVQYSSTGPPLLKWLGYLRSDSEESRFDKFPSHTSEFPFIISLRPELWQFPATYYNGTLHLHNTVTTPPDYTKSPSPLLETPNRIPSTATKLCTDIITPSNGVSKDP
eukprot:g8347.t1